MLLFLPFLSYLIILMDLDLTFAKIWINLVQNRSYGQL